MRRGFKTWAEKAALEQRRLLNLGAEAPLPARLLASCLNVTIACPNEIPGMPPDILHQLLYSDPESWSATTLIRDGCIIIIHNPNHSARRQESDLMHELAHILCNHNPSRLVQYENLPSMLRSYDADTEDEAYRLVQKSQSEKKSQLGS